jgi:hypothetical protein
MQDIFIYIEANSDITTKQQAVPVQAKIKA